MNKTVLIIDDEGFDRTIISALIRQSGFDVIAEAAGGKEGLKKALELMPDIITLDKRMPDMDGLEVLAQLRTNDFNNPIIIIIIISGDESETIKTEAGALGVSHFLKKPVSRQSLKNVLNTL